MLLLDEACSRKAPDISATMAATSESATARVGDIDDPMPRTLVWSAAWEMTRQAEMSARDLWQRFGGEIDACNTFAAKDTLMLTPFADFAWTEQGLCMTVPRCSVLSITLDA